MKKYTTEQYRLAFLNACITMSRQTVTDGGDPISPKEYFFMLMEDAVEHPSWVEGDWKDEEKNWKWKEEE